MSPPTLNHLLGVAIKMSDLVLTTEEIGDLFQGYAEPIRVNEDELSISITLRSIRDALMSAAESDSVGVNQLAKRLDVSPSVVSRMLRSEGDMRVSTAVLCARALGRVWDLTLSRMEPGHEGVNFKQKWQTIVEQPIPSWASEAPRPTIKNLNIGKRDQTFVSFSEG